MIPVDRWRVVPEASQVWVEGSSSIHPIRASASGLSGWLDAVIEDGTFAPGQELAGHVEIDVARLSSGNPLVDRETRRRVDAKRFPLITGDIERTISVAASEVTLEGMIRFRGEAVIVEGSLELAETADNVIVLEGRSIFDVRWWELRLPRLGLLRVHPDIEVAVRLTLEPAPSK